MFVQVDSRIAWDKWLQFSFHFHTFWMGMSVTAILCLSHHNVSELDRWFLIFQVHNCWGILPQDLLYPGLIPTWSRVLVFWAGIDKIWTWVDAGRGWGSKGSWNVVNVFYVWYGHKYLGTRGWILRSQQNHVAHIPNPGICKYVIFHGKRNIADVIILRYLRWENILDCSGQC